VTTLALSQLIERVAGLTLERGGMSVTLERHVAERMRVLGLRRVEDYIALAAIGGPEQRLLIEALTVRHTWFFRDPEQLQVITKLLVAATCDPISIWVAGCATGEEAYTLAMIGRQAARNLRILATDVNESALAFARRGVYSAGSAESVPERDRHWLSPSDDGFIVDPRLRSTVTFERHNLVDLPPRGDWDLVICRNVLIYFAPTPYARVFERFALALREGGSLVLGAGEIVLKPPAGFELVPMGKRLVLRRSGAASRPPPSSAPTTPPISFSPAARAPAATPGALPVVSRPGAPTTPGAAPAQAAPAAPERPRPSGRDDELVATLGRGHALLECGEIGAAIAVYTELSKRHPSIAEVWLFLGIACHVASDFEGAVNALRASRCLDPGLWPAVFFSWRALARTGRHAEARQMYELLATEGLRPIELQSTSALINELRAFQHDFQTAGRLAAQRAREPRLLRPPWRGT
jgi:chemotaxis protein methyltransferase CheR